MPALLVYAETMRRALPLVLALLAAACGPPPLANTYASQEALAEAVLDGLARADQPALEALALTEQEFRDHVWRELPAARPERNLPFSFIWGDLKMKSDLTLSRTVREFSGRRFELQRVEFTGMTGYPGFTVHREATFHVRDSAGTDMLLRVSGSMIEKDGAWKVFSYVIDD